MDDLFFSGRIVWRDDMPVHDEENDDWYDGDEAIDNYAF